MLLLVSLMEQYECPQIVASWGGRKEGYIYLHSMIYLQSRAQGLPSLVILSKYRGSPNQWI